MVEDELDFADAELRTLMFWTDGSALTVSIALQECIARLAATAVRPAMGDQEGDSEEQLQALQGQVEQMPHVHILQPTVQTIRPRYRDIGVQAGESRVTRGGAGDRYPSFVAL